MADLAGVWAKFHHAETHLDAFDALFREFLESDPYRVSTEFDAEAKVHRVRWVVRETPPVKLTLINGDLWSNLRASLDYLTWQLVLIGSGSPTDRTAFPCVKASENWAGAVGDRLKGIDPKWIAEIEKLQPYHGADPALHPLALLDSFNNINKHRLLPPIITTTERVTFKITGGQGRQFSGRNFLDRPVEEGTEVMRIIPASGDAIKDLNVEMKRGAEFRISFADGLNHPWDIDDVLPWVRSAIAVFEPAFAS